MQVLFQNCLLMKCDLLNLKNNKSASYNNVSNLVTDAVSFRSKNFLNMSSKKITDDVLSAINQKNKLGFGSEGTVYRISDTNYCVKIFNGSDLLNFGSWDFNISKKDKINHVVAKAQNGTTIMKYIDGEPLKWDIQKEVFNLPTDSYLKFIQQISDAKVFGMHFETSPANIIFNSRNKTLTAIDFKSEDDYYIVPTKVLSSSYTGLKAKGLTCEDKSNNRKLAGKILDILIKEITENKKTSFLITEEDIVDLFAKIKLTQGIDYPKQLDFLEKTVLNIFHFAENKTFTKKFQNEMNTEIKIANSIIKQILSY